ncbi:hypothetical protein IB259_00170 [Achromobacter sp. ACM04]|uniref:hypothetical protein n=1 Tax=Achromobacter sp. ACM04 TaxID=2769312 RepID=UPI00177D49DA|nr:hypothetical protein [Achromobacter sp. ACM04]MBD9417634.1 hypothetical protein [Achromobacter sp. ACM04]
MKLEAADLVRGSETPVGDGLTGAMRCILTLPNGVKRAAVVKTGSIGEVTAESFCALLLKAWGLDVPDPYIVRWPSGFAFGSADTGYPSLKQRVGISDQIPPGPIRDAAEKAACALVASFADTPLALCADEAIGNTDRNLGNILWDGRRVSWIDHARCLEEGEGYPDRNLLAVMAMLAGKEDSIAKSAVAQALALNRTVILEASDAAVEALGHGDPAAFVAKRINTLAARIISRFPAPADLLSPAP